MNVELASRSGIDSISDLLGKEADRLLSHRCATISKEQLHLPGPDWVDRIFGPSDRPTPVLRSLQALYNHGRLAKTGYLSLLPVDQGVEHSGGASFAKNPAYFDPEKIVQLAKTQDISITPAGIDAIKEIRNQEANIS